MMIASAESSSPSLVVLLYSKQSEIGKLRWKFSMQRKKEISKRTIRTQVKQTE